MTGWVERPPGTDEYHDYYRMYTSRVPPGHVLDAMEREIDETLTLLRNLSASQASYRYGPDKWSIKEVVGHVIDVERVFAVRALSFAREDPAPQPSFEQDDWAAGSNAHDRRLEDLASELQHVRAGNVIMFRSFTDEMAERRGVASGRSFSVRSIPYIVLGHEIHHRGVLRDRYLQ